MKRSYRIGALIQVLTDAPNQLFSLNHFCKLFNAAKSSISEDITAAKEIVELTGFGLIETIAGVAGGVKYIPYISQEKGTAFQQKLCAMLQEKNRVLDGGFLYTSDIMFNPAMVREMAQIFARKFRNSGADYVVTIETKGIPLALMTAELLNLPSVVVRREAKISEGPTMSINYFSGSYDRLQKMSISKRGAKAGTRALILDDFMRGGGSVKGITDILAEFDTQVAGVGIAIASVQPENKKVSNYIPLAYLGAVGEDLKTVEAFPNLRIF